MRTRQRRGTDEGFTLIELSVAMFLTLLVVSSLIGVFVGTLTGVAQSKQRQAATGLATGVMERFRAVDYGTLSTGLYCSDLVGDPNVVIVGGCGGSTTATFKPAGSAISEPVKLTTSTPASAVAGDIAIDPVDGQCKTWNGSGSARKRCLSPVYPHVQRQVLEGVTYTVRSYVTAAATAQASYNLTVIVSWTSSVSHGVKSTIQRSLEYSPTRCLSSATHPYQGACQAAFNGDAGITNAGITISNPDDATADILGLGGSAVELALPSLSSTLGVEQVTKLAAKSQGTAATTTTGGAADMTGGGISSVSADTDPSSTTASGTASGTMAQASAGAGSISGAAGVLSATPSTTDSGHTDSRVSSTASSCKDGSATVIDVSTRACSWADVTASGSTAELRLALANSAPNFRLATVGVPSSSSTASVARLVTTRNGACPSTSGLGCVSSQGRRALGTVSLGGLPSAGSGDLAPAGFTGFWLTVSALQESAYAESGVGTRLPAFSRSGTLKYYNPPTKTYLTVDLATQTADLPLDLGSISGTYFQGGHRTDITLTASVRVGANKMVSPSTSAPDATCKAQACTASATGPSALTASFRYDVFVDSALSTSFVMTTDLGSVLAKSAYKAAFDG